MLAQTIVVLDNSDYVEALASKFEDKILSTIFIGLFVGMGFFFVFSKKILPPIQQLSEGANKIASSAFGSAIHINGDTEFSDLSDNSNQMSEYIELLIADRDSAQGFFYSPAVEAAALPSAVEKIENYFEES